METKCEYVTVKRKPREVQVSWEDILLGKIAADKEISTASDPTATWTSKKDFGFVEQTPAPVAQIIYTLESFNQRYKDLFEADRESLYSHFYIPKKSGGFRKIDDPCDKLQSALRELKGILTDTGLLYHSAAYAYIKDRSTVDCVRKHANFRGNFFLKTDVSGFFPSTTLDYVMKMLSMVYPISRVIANEKGRQELEKALSLAFLNGGLPQGTCLSPMLTNVICIPLDYELQKKLGERNILYTRYADDMHMSAVKPFPYKQIVNLITDTFREFGAPYVIKPEKTHYGSNKGKNWMLGLMLNGNYEITVGNKNKKQFNAAIDAFVKDTKNGKRWDLEDVMRLRGLISYYLMVEPEYFKRKISTLNVKYKTNIIWMLQQYLNP